MHRAVTLLILLGGACGAKEATCENAAEQIVNLQIRAADSAGKAELRGKKKELLAELVTGCKEGEPTREELACMVKARSEGQWELCGAKHGTVEEKIVAVPPVAEESPKAPPPPGTGLGTGSLGLPDEPKEKADGQPQAGGDGPSCEAVAKHILSLVAGAQNLSDDEKQMMKAMEPQLVEQCKALPASVRTCMLAAKNEEEIQKCAASD
jgi:hypothetical protein